jgi:hypothetical protein
VEFNPNRRNRRSKRPRQSEKIYLYIPPLARTGMKAQLRPKFGIISFEISGV